MHTKLKNFLLEELKHANKGFASHLIRLNEYKQLIEMTSFIKNGNIMERIYHVINDFPGIPICKGLVPSCNGVLKFQNLKLGYQKYCCKCFTKSPEFSKKMIDAQKNRSPENEKIRRYFDSIEVRLIESPAIASYQVIRRDISVMDGKIIGIYP